ncbi:MAG TPA: polysaccharide biosynthesis/export family protein [Sphingomonas sp.]|jgi:polysaccharide export outer membrane protein|uniref:polysaccharide biosynthesis/export family protein n=1 Tax=Sphingomonas sp. TaxID=28214 RepID=UPI002ED9376E
MNRLAFASLAFMAPLAVTGCATGTSAPVLSAAEFQRQQPISAATLGPGDRIRLSLYGEDSFTGQHDVAADGTVSLPLIGAVRAGGLTIGDFARAVEARLSEGYYQSPRIAAEIVNLQPIYVLGEVNKPGSFPYAPDMTLSKAAALAGGYTYRARMNAVAIRRARAGAEAIVEADQALPLAPGDTVRVLERYF